MPDAIPQGARDWFRAIERRIMRLERRGTPNTVQSVLGPGIAAQAVRIMDWNSRDVTLNGFYYSGVGSINSPDSELTWTGQVIAKDDGTGMQQVWNTDGPENLYWMRTYSPDSLDPTLLIFTEWKKFATASGFIGTDELDPAVVAQIESGGGPTEAPAESPAIRLMPQPTTFGIIADPVEPGTFIEYHVKEGNDPTFVPVAGDPATLSGIPTQATVYVANELPDGTAFKLDTDYTWASIATNGIAPNPAPSAPVVGRLDPSALEDLFVTTLQAGFVLTGKITIGQITIDANTGITIPQPGGVGSINFPANGTAASISVPLQIIGQLIVEGGGSIQGQMTVFGNLLLSNVIPDPTVPPSVFLTYPSTLISGIGGWAGYLRGLCDSSDGTKWIMARRDTGIEPRALIQIDKTTGAVTDVALPTAIKEVFGVTRIESTLYVLCVKSTTRPTPFSIYAFSESTLLTTGNYVVDLQFDTSEKDPALGCTGTGATDQILVAYHRPGTDEGYIDTFNKATGGRTQSAWFSMGTGTPYNMSYVGRGEFDFGAGNSRNMIAFRSGEHTVKAYELFESGGAQIANQPLDNFPVPFEDFTLGMWWDGAHFWHLNNSGWIRQHSTYHASPDRVIRAAYAWRDDNATGGTHETLPSPESDATVIPARASFSVEGTPAPEASLTTDNAANRLAIYARDDGTAGLHLQTGGVLAAGERELVVEGLNTTGAAPKASNEFAAIAALGLLEAGTGGFWVDGRSDGSVGTGTFRDSVDARANARIGATVAGGRFTGTTNGSGIVTVPHNLGVTPGGITVSQFGSPTRLLRVESRSATNFTVLVATAGNVAVASGNADFLWIAIV